MNSIKFLTAKPSKWVGKYYYSIDDELKVFYSVKKENLILIIKNNVSDNILVEISNLLQDNRAFVIDISSQKVLLLKANNDIERINIKKELKSFDLRKVKSSQKAPTDLSVYINSLYSKE